MKMFYVPHLVSQSQQNNVMSWFMIKWSIKCYWLSNRVKYGPVDLLYAAVLAVGSRYLRLCLAFLSGASGPSLNMSLWRDPVAVLAVKRREIFVLLDSSPSKPRAWSCWVMEGSQKPTLAAIATLWDLSRLCFWALLMLEGHTGHTNSRWTLLSAFQYSTSVSMSNRRAFILLKAQVVLLALTTIWFIWESHPKFDWTISPKIFTNFFSSKGRR